MKKEIKRENLNNNFLKNCIIRFDYTGLAEVELDNIIVKAKPIFKADGYMRLKEEYMTELDFALQDPERMDMEDVPIKEVRKKRVYVFVNEKKDIECKISPQFALISVRSQNYIPFCEYSKTLIDVIKIIKKEIAFLNIIRFGIRKVNQCIIKDICSLDRYFEKKCFPIYALEKGKIPKLFESKDCFAEGRYNINFIRTVLAGEYDGATAFQIVMDLDIYMTEIESIHTLIEEGTEITVMNERLFSLYKETLTEAFLDKLGRESFHDSNIIGVEKNG